MKFTHAKRLLNMKNVRFRVALSALFFTMRKDMRIDAILQVMKHGTKHSMILKV